MSFDLAFWVEDRPITTAAATDHYATAITDGAGQGLPGPEVTGFLATVLKRWPPLEELAEELVEESPWSMSPHLQTSTLFLTLTYPGARKIHSDLGRLADEHGLVMFDPQQPVVRLPSQLGQHPHLRLTTESGQVIDHPTAEEIAVAVGALNAENSFLILERRSQFYMQTKVDNRGRFAVEYRSGGPDSHYCVEDLGIRQATWLLASFGSDSTEWASAVEWRRLEF